ncbi:cell division control protein 24 [Rhodotorula toruloides]|uniref:Cell division control protein 24 n=1 Tax=Rhodotorula toruloides TaxID=5286 RepID=A0A511KNF0_RHOTO|nr:cell division control protein 24 [Rhodotorula toruloides]
MSIVPKQPHQPDQPAFSSRTGTANGYDPSSVSRSASRNGHLQPHPSPLLSAPFTLTPGAGGSGSGSSSPGLGNGSVGVRPAMDRMPSTLGDTPVATNSALNKAASASSSIYQRCSTVRDRLYRVPDFQDRFLRTTPAADATLLSASSSSSNTPTLSPALGASTSAAPPDLATQTDPVSQVLSVLRLGSSLCFLFNQLGHPHQLDVNPQATLSNLKACQRGAAHFIMACKQDLKWPEEDLFAVNELYGQDTNGVVKASSFPFIPLLFPRLADEKEIGGGQDYQRQLQMNDILTQDQIHSLFINLNKLADFQRRFLIGVETNASLPPEQQRFGNLFLQMEDNFACYEPYCANLTNAQDLAIAENAALSKLAHVLDPVSELAPLLIKPVQRICKYPLLISQLLKNTPDTFPFYDELKAGLESIMRVTDKVNEEKRRKDNAQAVDDLARRVEDWKGHDINSFGDLLLQETFVVIKSDNEREYQVYLFERIILCCKEVTAQGKKDKKSNSLLKRPPSQRINKLQLKGRIFVNNITGASQIHARSGQYLLEVRWRGDVTEEAFTIKCRTEELLRQWQKAINKAVEEAPTRRRAHHLSSSRRSERGVHSPASQFPPTPMSEYGPLGSAASSIYSYHTTESSFASPANGAYPHGHSYGSLHAAHSPYPPSHSGPGTPHLGFDDEHHDDGHSAGFYEPSESGRSTPSMRRGPVTRSLPAEQRQDGHAAGAPHRPRAQTEDSSSIVINQWRNQTPGQPGTPNLPSQSLRGMSSTSSMAGGDAQSLRSSASSRQLRNKQSTEWGGPGSITSSPALSSYSRLPTQEEEAMPRMGQPGAPIYRQASHQYPAQTATVPPMLRNRSASSPNIYQTQGGRFPDSPQMPDGIDHAYAAAGKAGQRGVGTHSGGTLSSMSASSQQKRSSTASSNATDHSSATSAHSSSALPYSTPNGRGLISPPAAAGAASAVRVKVYFGEDSFVVVVLDNVSYPDLVEKVLKKIRMCGGDKVRVEGSAVRLRYRDEDGDRILITSEEDVSMAFETARIIHADKAASGAPLELVLYASVDGQ